MLYLECSGVNLKLPRQLKTTNKSQKSEISRLFLFSFSHFSRDFCFGGVIQDCALHFAMTKQVETSDDTAHSELFRKRPHSTALTSAASKGESLRAHSTEI